MRKTLPKEKGSEASQIWIVLLKDLGNYALYLNKSGNYFSGFEVHKIRIKKAREINFKPKDGKVIKVSIPERRALAFSEEFGHYAWTYPTLKAVYAEHPNFKKYNDEITEAASLALFCVKEHRRKSITPETNGNVSKSLAVYDGIAKKGVRSSETVHQRAEYEKRNGPSKLPTAKAVGILEVVR